MKAFIKIMKALSDPNRIKIIKMLQERELCVCEIQAVLDVSQSSVSKHLKILEDSELVNSRKEGLWVNYSLADGKSSPYAATLLGNLQHWLNDEPEIHAILSKIPLLNREELCKG